MTDDINLQRSIWGDLLVAKVSDLTGTDRGDAFSDGVAYMLHAEVCELVRIGEKTPEEATTDLREIAQGLLNRALESFLGDEEDGPFVWEPEEDIAATPCTHCGEPSVRLVTSDGGTVGECEAHAL